MMHHRHHAVRAWLHSQPRTGCLGKVHCGLCNIVIGMLCDSKGTPQFSKALVPRPQPSHAVSFLGLLVVMQQWRMTPARDEEDTAGTTRSVGKGAAGTRKTRKYFTASVEEIMELARSGKSQQVRLLGLSCILNSASLPGAHLMSCMLPAARTWSLPADLVLKTLFRLSVAGGSRSLWSDQIHHW